MSNCVVIVFRAEAVRETALKLERFMKSRIETDGPRAFPLKQDLAPYNGTEIYHQAVRAWKALVGMVGGKGGVPLFAAWAKARINPLDPGVVVRPAFSSRFQGERLTAWWSKSDPAVVQIPEKGNVPVETLDVSALHQVPAVHALQFPGFGLAFQKLCFTIRYYRSRCLGNRLKRPVFGEFRIMRLKQHLRSLPNRSRDRVVPPQLPSSRWFMFRSCRLLATSTCPTHRAHKTTSKEYPR